MASFKRLANSDSPNAVNKGESNMERRRRELEEMGTGEKQKGKKETEIEYQRRTRGNKKDE